MPAVFRQCVEGSRGSLFARQSHGTRKPLYGNDIPVISILSVDRNRAGGTVDLCQIRRLFGQDPVKVKLFYVIDIIEFISVFIVPSVFSRNPTDKYVCLPDPPLFPGRL